MGRNSYIGGHTIINTNTDFFDERKTASENKKRALICAKKQLLNSVIDAELDSKVVSKVSRSFVKLIGKDIQRKGGIHQWANTQPNYEALKLKKMRKKAVRQSIANNNLDKSK